MEKARGYLREEEPGTGNSRCKGPEAWLALAGLGKMDVAEVQWGGRDMEYGIRNRVLLDMGLTERALCTSMQDLVRASLWKDALYSE